MARYTSHHVVLISFIFTLILSSCVKNDLEELEKNEKNIISKYLSDNGISADTRTDAGIYYIEDLQGTGLSPQTDNFVFINFTGRNLEDMTIRETSQYALINEWPAANYFDNYLFGAAKLLYGYSMPGINEGLSLMKEGGKARLIIPGDLANYDYNPLLYEIELLKVVRDPLAYEDSVIQEYLVQKQITDTVMIDTTAIYFESHTGDPASELIAANDTVYIKFKGRLLDGFGSTIKDDRVFDQSDSLRFVYGQSKITHGEMLAIPEGFKKALGIMRKGTIATVIIRYPGAFKEGGIVHKTYNYTIVPPFQTVVYAIEIQDVRQP